jgi:ABC-type branched-subunit amino acid transport system ATPase component/predicted MFS family arabinose efflux permease
MSERGRAVGTFLHELRPSVATGGAPASPLVILFLLNALDELDGKVFAILSPEIRDWFGISLGTVATLGAVGALLTIAVAIPIGFLSDRWRRTLMVGLGALIWAGFTLSTGLATGVLMLAVFRTGSGLAKTMSPAVQSLLADYYPREVRGTVFAFHAIANPLGSVTAVLLGGWLASATGLWQVPFFVFAIPSFIVGAIALVRLREPVRGEQERRSLDADEETALRADTPPSLGDSFRTVFGVRTLRRIYLGIPFVVGSGAVIGILAADLYDTKFGLGPGTRGIIAALDEPAAILGLLVGGGLTNRLLRRRPGRVVTFLGLLTASVAISFTLMALTSWLPLVLVLSVVRAFSFAVLAPAAFSLMSLVVPPRVRGMAASMMSICAVPGVIFAAFAGRFADDHGTAGGMLVMSGVFLVGAAIWTSAGSHVEHDMRAAVAASMALEVTRQSEEAGAAKLLVCRDVDVSYGNVQVLFNVDFDVEAGEIVALLGTNGAGKSTLLRAVAGLTTPANGAILYGGDDITHVPAHEHASRGIVMVNGGRGIFPTLTVAENLQLAGWAHRRDDEHVRASTEEAMAFFPVLRERFDDPAGDLSGGQQQMLALAQAFLSKPRLMMIDELSLGLAPAIVEQLLEIVRAIHAAGTTIILVEQSVNVALTVAERAVFMEKGEVRFTGRTADLLARSDVLRSVFLHGSSSGGVGSLARARHELGRPGERDTVLEVEDVYKRFGGVAAINGPTFSVREGEILGFIGPNGAGKTTLFDIISGFTIPDEGTVRLFGEDVTQLPPDARAKLGLMRSFQDAALFSNLTVFENLLVALEKSVAVKSATMAALRLPNVKRSEARLRARAERLIELSNLQDYSNKFVKELSTGSRRIVDLACILAADPRIILLDEPSSGVAQRETEELGPLLLRIRQETGCAMLLIEHDMPLIRLVSDELVALDLGALVTRGAPDEVIEHPHVVASYLGTSREAIHRSGSR